MVINDGVTKLEALGGKHEKSPVTKDNNWKAGMAAYESHSKGAPESDDRTNKEDA